MWKLFEGFMRSLWCPFFWTYAHSHLWNFLLFQSSLESNCLCPCLSLSEPQHLRKTHQCPQHDDVICREPAASRPVHRWQCCTSKTYVNPVNPVPYKQQHTHFEFTESHWISAVIDSCLFLLFFCPSLCHKDLHMKKKNSEYWIGSYWIRPDVTLLSSQEGSVKDQPV